jgi:hypothetical protein
MRLVNLMLKRHDRPFITVRITMRLRCLVIIAAISIGLDIARAQTNSIFIADNVMTGQMWLAPTNAGNGTGGSCALTANNVQYFSAPFFTDTTASTYTLQLFYQSFQSGFVYLYQDAFDPQNPCAGIVMFGFAPIANISNIQLDANRQYVFVTSEDVLFGGGGSFQVTITGPAGSHMQLGAAPTVPIAFCFGDGSGTACPCGNSGAADSGCPNSANAAGAKLEASGSASIAGDTLVLTGTGMPNGTALYFQGRMPINGGTGALFGDGLRCVGSVVVRMGTKTNSGGSSSYPVSGDTPISVKGADAAGQIRYYQCWYRDSTPFCTTSTFNLTNALQVTWTP